MSLFALASVIFFLCISLRLSDLLDDLVCLLYSMLYVIFFFFFQAEDGIRDLTVTGVQTCALPISPRARAIGAPLHSRGTALAVVSDLPLGHRRPIPARPSGHGEQGVRSAPRRSEERRVGKECRSRWSPYH